MTALEVLKMAFDCGIDIQVQGDNLHLNAKQAPSNQLLAELKQHKSELLLLLAANESYSPFSLNNYSHCVTCNQCEYLALTGSCSRLGKRVNPQAMRECGSFQLLKKERPPLEEVKPYAQDELNKLLNQAAKPLYHHLIDCQQCSLEDTRYCVEGFGLGNTFDCLLLCFDDAADKRYKLMNQVIKARVSGRRAFESLFIDNAPAPLPRQDAPITRKWGNTKEYEAFINHWTACKVCKPNLNRYCDEGQQLKSEPDY